MHIIADNVTHIYESDGVGRVVALRGVSVRISAGEFIGVIGQTGSGKSTLIQHFNGLLKPTSGRVFVDGEDLSQKSTNLKTIRQKVGLVFQYPEDQFFEETVFDEVAFGLRNMGLDEDSISERVRYSLSVVGLDAKDLEGRSPFRLSGGQKRRLAIASVLAMKPKVLILDEPTAGLDPGGKRKIMDSIYSLHLRVGMTVVLVTHDIEMLCRYAKRVIVMHNGAIALDGPTAKVFWERDKLREIGLRPPEVVLLVQKLRDKGFHLDSTVVTVEQARKAILEHFGRTADA